MVGRRGWRHLCLRGRSVLRVRREPSFESTGRQHERRSQQWLLVGAADGGVFSYNEPFYGSEAGKLGPFSLMGMFFNGVDTNYVLLTSLGVPLLGETFCYSLPPEPPVMTLIVGLSTIPGTAATDGIRPLYLVDAAGQVFVENPVPAFLGSGCSEPP